MSQNVPLPFLEPVQKLVNLRLPIYWKVSVGRELSTVPVSATLDCNS